MGTPGGVYANLDELGNATQGVDSSPGFEFESRSERVTFSTQNIAPPSNLYLQLEDTVYFYAYNRNPNVSTIVLNMRMLTPDGLVKTLSYPLAIPSNGNFTARFCQIAEGYVLSLIIGSPGVLPRRGECFAVAGVLRGGITGSGVLTQMLCADYITAFTSPAFPQGRIIAATEGSGHLTAYLGATPSAGAEFIFQLPASVRWRLVNALCILTTSAAVGNRQVRINFNDGVRDYFVAGVPGNIAPSTNSFINVGDRLSALSDGNGTFMLSGPTGQALFGAFTVRSVTTGLQAGDQWSGCYLTVEEWLEQ